MQRNNTCWGSDTLDLCFINIKSTSAGRVRLESHKLQDNGWLQCDKDLREFKDVDNDRVIYGVTLEKDFGKKKRANK